MERNIAIMWNQYEKFWQFLHENTMIVGLIYEMLKSLEF
jgi:hypothetical protein